MKTIELVKKYELFVAPEFFDQTTCRKIIAQTSNESSAPATVYGRTDSGSVDDRVRRASRFTPSKETLQLVTQRLMAYKEAVEQHFYVRLHDCEEPQFLRYNVGDFFVAHQDGNTGLIRLATENERKISVVIFLNRQTIEPSPGTYCGGSLKFSDYRAEPEYRTFDLPIEPGMLVAFRSELTHEVTPVTHGERYSIVSWYR